MDWARLDREIVSCARCPRLRAHCRTIAHLRRRAFRDQEYWGRPVPGFGDRLARLLIVGLAPGAHGANRTGRMFTGDASGDWLWAALHGQGFANRPDAVDRADGLALDDAFVTAAARCAPPDNRPTAEELLECSRFFDREVDALDRVRVVVALGSIAWEAVVRRARRVAPETVERPRPRFGHGARTDLAIRPGAAPICLLGSYHPSRQNTQTGRLTRAMFAATFRRARRQLTSAV